MLKKAMLVIIIIFTGFFIYNTYIRKDNTVYEAKYKTTSFGVEYTNGIYVLKAKEMVENSDDKTMTATDLVLINGDSVLKSKNGIKQANDDVTLTGDVTGENDKNGWLVKGQELNYYKDFNRVNSNLPVDAYNSIKKLSISGDYFESNIAFDDILLDRNVNAYTENFELLGEKAFYKNEILELVNNVQVEIKSLNKSNDKANSVVGVFPGATYDSKTRILKASGAYQMYYKDMTINADELIYDENTDIITSKGNVTVSGEKLYGTFVEAKFNVKEDKIYLTGPINAGFNDLMYTGDNAVYNNAKGTFEVIGNATVTSGENILNAGRLFYTQKTNTVEVFGEKGTFKYYGTNKELTGNYARFIADKNLIEVPGVFRFKYLTSQGENIDGTGEGLKLDTVTQKGDAKRPVLIQGNDKITADKGSLDFLNGVYKLKGKVIGNYGDYKITTEEVDYIENNQTIAVNVPYNLVSKNSDLKIWGNNVTLDTVKYKLDAKGRTNFKTSSLEAYGTDLTYDLNAQTGKFSKDFYGITSGNGTILTGNVVDFRINDFVTLKENVKATQKDFIATTTNVTYYYATEKINMPEVTDIDTRGRGLFGRANNGVYDVKKAIYTGNNFKGWSEKANLSSNFIIYDVNKSEAFMRENILMKDKDTGMEIKGKEMVYYLKTNMVISKEPIEIKRDNILITAKSGSANLVEKSVVLDKTIMTTSNKDRISGDKLKANLIKNEFTFDGNIEGTLYSLSQEELQGIKEVDYSNPIKFKGDTTKAFFIENGKNQYIITRNEIINSSEFIYKDLKLQGDFIEIENSDQQVFAKGNSKLSLLNGNKISAESITMDMAKEITNFKNNVTITNTSGVNGGINTKSDKAVFKNKENLVDLEGNIESYKGKTKIQADKGVYDLLTNKLSGKGNIFMSLDFQTAEQTKQKQKREKELNDKIQKAQNVSEPVEVVSYNINQIELKKQVEGVNILWKSSNDDYITSDGRVNHPTYKESDITITLSATYICEEQTKVVNYKVLVKKSDAKTYLRDRMDKELLYLDGNRVMIANSEEGIKVKFISGDEKLIDSKGYIKSDDYSKLNGISISLLYTLEGTSINKEYRGSYINGTLKFISLPY